MPNTTSSGHCTCEQENCKCDDENRCSGPTPFWPLDLHSLIPCLTLPRYVPPLLPQGRLQPCSLLVFFNSFSIIPRLKIASKALARLGLFPVAILPLSPAGEGGDPGTEWRHCKVTPGGWCWWIWPESCFKWTSPSPVAMPRSFVLVPTLFFVVQCSLEGKTLVKTIRDLVTRNVMKKELEENV